MGNFQPLSIGLNAFFPKNISEGTPSAHLQMGSPLCAFLSLDYLWDPPLSGYYLGLFSCFMANHVTQSYPMGEGFLCVYSLKDAAVVQGRQDSILGCELSCICIREAEGGQDLRLDFKASRPAPVALLLQRNHLLKVPQPSNTDQELRHTGLWRAFYI